MVNISHLGPKINLHCKHFNLIIILLKINVPINVTMFLVWMFILSHNSTQFSYILPQCQYFYLKKGGAMLKPCHKALLYKKCTIILPIVCKKTIIYHLAIPCYKTDVNIQNVHVQHEIVKAHLSIMTLVYQ